VDIDSSDGSVVVLLSEGTIYGSGVLRFDPKDGRVIQIIEGVGGVGLDINPKDRNVWIVGKNIYKLKKEGETLFSLENIIGWCAVDVSVDPNDGSAWIVERDHPDEFGSQNRLIKVSGSGEILKAINVQYNLFSVSVDLIISGSPLRVSLFALTLSYSRYKFARLFFLERQECFFTGHVEAFSYFGGVPKQVTYDNLTTAVAKILKGRARTEQEAFVRFRGEFPFKSNFAAKRKANEKGKVENQIGYIKSHAFALDKEFDSIEDANAYLLGWLDKDAKRVHGTHKEVILARFEREKPSLNPLPSTMPECCRIAHAKVNKFSFVPFDTNRYSVTTEYVYSDVIVKGYERRVVIIKGEKAIAEHERLRGRREEQINPYHFLSLLEKKSRAVDHAVVMKSFKLDPVFYQLKDKLAEVSENPNREWIKVLRLTEKYEMQQVISAVRMADAYGVCDYSSIKNLIHQQVTPTKIVDVEDCLINHPTLTDVIVNSQPLSCYDSLLPGGGPINE